MLLGAYTQPDRGTTMAVWTTKPVSEQPEIILSNWRIFETPEGTRHFVGKNLTGNGTGRVSSAVTVFDKTTMTGVTSSGRVYQLLGDPGFSGDAAYVWGVWCAHNGVYSCNDITSDFSLAPLADPSLEVSCQEIAKSRIEHEITMRPINDNF